MVNLTTRNDGKSAEGFVQDALTSLERKHKSTFIRLYDSKSAGLGSGGNFIPEQPGDFVFVYESTSVLLEVKSSNIHKSLRDATLRSVFSENQILGARLWTRAGSRALCAFYSLGTQSFEIWAMADVVSAFLAPARQRKLRGAPQVVCGNTPECLIQALQLVLM